MAVTPQAGLTSVIPAGGSPVMIAPADINGGFVTNPASAADQGVSPAETLYIDVVTAPGLAANGTTVGLAPGQSMALVPGTTLPTWANATTSGHKFSIVTW